MSDWLSSWTSLPNLHPALVHFPVAFVPAALAFDLVAAVSRRHRDWLARGATALWVLAAAGAGAAYWAGREAADSLVEVPPQVQAHVSTHSDWALYTLWTLGLLAALRLLVAWRTGAGRRGWPSAAFAVLGLGAVGLVFHTADLGGGLVFEHGVAVASRAPSEVEGEAEAERGGPPAAPAASTGPSERLERAANGGLTWRPLPEDRGALGTVIEPSEGTGGTVRWVEPAAEVPPGLELQAEGRTLLVLPGSFGDVEVEAEIVPEGFEGVVGLAHHARSAAEVGLLTVTVPAGEFALERMQGGEGEVLDQGSRQLPDGPLDLAVSAAGRHLRGTLGGELVVHGHAAPLPEGGTGLFLDGHGRIRIVELKVTPISH